MSKYTLPPGPRIPAILQMAEACRDSAAFFERCSKKYGSVFTLRIPTCPPLIVIHDPDLIRWVLSADPEWVSTMPATRLLESVFGKRGMLQQDGKAHAELRKPITRTLREGLDFSDSLLTACLHQRISTWEKRKRIVLADEFHKIMGVPTFYPFFPNAEKEEIESFVDDMIEMNRIAANPVRFLTIAMADNCRLSGLIRNFPVAMGRFFRLRDKVSNTVGKLLETGVDCPQAGKCPVPFDNVSDREAIVSTLLTTLAGFSTTSAALSWVFTYLFAYPKWIEKILEDESDLVLEAVIREALRLNPPLPQSPRSLLKPREMAGYNLPAGVDLVANFYLTQRREEGWAFAKEFRPQRFIEENEKSGAWMGFGYGFHHCPGRDLAMRQMKYVISEILKRVEMEPLGENPAKSFISHVTTTPVDGVPVEVTSVNLPSGSAVCPVHSQAE